MSEQSIYRFWHNPDKCHVSQNNMEKKKKKILSNSSVQRFHIRIWLDTISFSHLSLHLQLHILLSRCRLEVSLKFNCSEQPPPALRFNLSQKATLTETQTLSHIHRHLSGDVSDKHSTVNQRCTFSP